MQKEIIYHAAAYLRLSREDIVKGDYGSGKVESDSIKAQREMICAFIQEQADMELYGIYADDGCSGTNFDRPEFHRMIQEIEAGAVNCVIVKDLSRLGRDYIEAGRLIQKTFPAFSVRFISLTDQYDSLFAKSSETSVIVPLKNFMNDSYAWDISTKVRSHQKLKREQGEFIGAFSVYGYEKSKKNKNRLVPDAYAADIVKKIFAWKIEGYSNAAIAELLEEQGVLSPLEYKRINGKNFQTGFFTGERARWSAVAVKRILTNENYIGTLVQGKEEKINYKIKKIRKKPCAEWVRVQKAQEPVIEAEDFNFVQELLKLDARATAREKKAHSYTGLLFCGDCKKPMVRRVSGGRGRKTISFICATKNKGKGCSRHVILEETLNKLVTTVLKQQISLFSDSGRVCAAIGQIEPDATELSLLRGELEKLEREQQKYRILETALYEDFKRQLLTGKEWRDYKEIYEMRYRKLEQIRNRQEENIKKVLCAKKEEKEFAERKAAISRCCMENTFVPDRIFLVTFVKRILVYEEKRVTLELRYRDMSVE